MGGWVEASEFPGLIRCGGQDLGHPTFPSGTKAHSHFERLSAQLKPRPFKASNDSGPIKTSNDSISIHPVII
jgi:hypothetical protein